MVFRYFSLAGEGEYAGMVSHGSNSCDTEDAITKLFVGKLRLAQSQAETALTTSEDAWEGVSVAAANRSVRNRQCRFGKEKLHSYCH